LIVSLVLGVRDMPRIDQHEVRCTAIARYVDWGQCRTELVVARMWFANLMIAAGEEAVQIKTFVINTR
jgi:hypothetical protein